MYAFCQSADEGTVRHYPACFTFFILIYVIDLLHFQHYLKQKKLFRCFETKTKTEICLCMFETCENKCV